MENPQADRPSHLPDTEPPSRGRQRPSARGLVVSFVLLFLLTEPPAVYLIANRIEPTVGSVPFLVAYLLVLYTGMIGVLLAAALRERRG